MGEEVDKELLVNSMVIVSKGTPTMGSDNEDLFRVELYKNRSVSFANHMYIIY